MLRNYFNHLNLFLVYVPDKWVEIITRTNLHDFTVEGCALILFKGKSEEVVQRWFFLSGTMSKLIFLSGTVHSSGYNIPISVRRIVVKLLEHCIFNPA